MDSIRTYSFWKMTEECAIKKILRSSISENKKVVCSEHHQTKNMQMLSICRKSMNMRAVVMAGCRWTRQNTIDLSLWTKNRKTALALRRRSKSIKQLKLRSCSWMLAGLSSATTHKWKGSRPQTSCQTLFSCLGSNRVVRPILIKSNTITWIICKNYN